VATGVGTLAQRSANAAREIKEVIESSSRCLQMDSTPGTRILPPAAAAEMRRLQYTVDNKPDNVELDEKNAGLFWSTKFNGRFVGHGGSDPCVRTEMLARPAGDLAVIVFTNTSLAEAQGGVYAELFKDLWQHAQVLQSTTE
jgi:hypothetical protein